ncbi:5744_t:CDS:1 [Entrophospora sp. SA101]|nr:13140_t:CDS:1 [Entrophospora sp. SA101]CAJ0633342.1 6726_t:CDS:1 [Entrophospora sp. SA101]CAJ0760510.1 1207_t:CDS:1 [Entrophospora sp. SA101]CAJ0764599.1 5744_t:CDS:1 [Entrophospora sp. SA101]CAJ0824158.1 17642_t:CDS:1 [Entrophospora sp. SA101]
MYEFLSTLRTTFSNYYDNSNTIYLTKSQIDILNNKFSYYPSSIIRDVIVTKLVSDISLQGQLFKKLTISSIGTSANLSNTMYFIINKLNESKTEDLLINSAKNKNNDDIRIWVDSELMLSEVMMKCDQMKSEYADITKNLNTIQRLLQERKTGIIEEEKKLARKIKESQYRGIKSGFLKGLGLGTVTAIPIYIYISPFDCGIIWITTVVMGVVLGATLNEKRDKKQEKALLLKEDLKHIDSIVVDVKEIKKSVGVFENYWLNQFNLVGDSRNSIIANITNNNNKNNYDKFSILKSWIQAKKDFDDYQTNCKQFTQ